MMMLEKAEVGKRYEYELRIKHIKYMKYILETEECSPFPSRVAGSIWGKRGADIPVVIPRPGS
jgi:hypothetical protein